MREVHPNYSYANLVLSLNVIVVQKLVQDLVANIQKASPWYQVDTDTARVVQALAPLFKHPWPSDQNYMDNPEREVLFVRSESSAKVSYLMEEFFV